MQSASEGTPVVVVVDSNDEERPQPATTTAASIMTRGQAARLGAPGSGTAMGAHPPSGAVPQRSLASVSSFTRASDPAAQPNTGMTALNQRYQQVMSRYNVASMNDLRVVPHYIAAQVAVSLAELIESFISTNGTLNADGTLERSVTDFGPVQSTTSYASFVGSGSGIPVPAPRAMGMHYSMSVDGLDQYDHVSASAIVSRVPSPTPFSQQQQQLAAALAARRVASTNNTPTTTPQEQCLEVGERTPPALGATTQTTYYRTMSMASAASVLTFHPGQTHQVPDTTVVVRDRAPDGSKRINNYTIIGDIGRGAYGKVKLALTDDGEQVAIKVLNKNNLMKKDPRAMEKVRREIAVMKNVHHPNLAQLREVISDPDSNKIYLVMRYFSKGQVVEVGKDNRCTPLPPEKVGHCFKQVVEGLRVLHRNKIFHRDVKPQNFLQDENGCVCLADFGVAAICVDGQGVMGIEGTPYFMSPEILRNEPQVNGELVDIWALGVSMYMLMYGRPPFEGESVMSTMHEIQNTDVTFPEGGPADFNAVVQRMLARDPHERITLRGLRRTKYYRSIVLPGSTIVDTDGTVTRSPTTTPAAAAKGDDVATSGESPASLANDAGDNDTRAATTTPSRSPRLRSISSPSGFDNDDETEAEREETAKFEVKVTEDDLACAFTVDTGESRMSNIFSPSHRVEEIRRIRTTSQLYGSDRGSGVFTTMTAQLIDDISGAGAAAASASRTTPNSSSAAGAAGAAAPGRTLRESLSTSGTPGTAGMRPTAGSPGHRNSWVAAPCDSPQPPESPIVAQHHPLPPAQTASPSSGANPRVQRHTGPQETQMATQRLPSPVRPTFLLDASAASTVSLSPNLAQKGDASSVASQHHSSSVHTSWSLAEKDAGNASGSQLVVTTAPPSGASSQCAESGSPCSKGGLTPPSPAMRPQAAAAVMVEVGERNGELAESNAELTASQR